MANEVTWALIEGDYGYDYRLLAESTVDALYETAAPILPFLNRKSLAGFPSESERFPVAPSLTASGLVDGQDMSNTAYNPTNVTLTVGEVGLLLTVTDLNDSSSIHDFARYGREAGQAVAEKLMTDIAALGGGFSNATSNTGQNITEQEFRDAKTALVIRKIPGPFFALLYPQTVNDLETSIGSSISAAATTGTSARAETNDISMAPGLNAGSLYNVTILASTTVATANANADSASFMAGSQRAIAYVEKWAIRPEMERDASLRGTEVAVTSAYAVGEVDDAAGQGLIFDR